MKFYEKNLEDLIWEYSQDNNKKHELIKRGFPGGHTSIGKFYRQFNLHSYGIIDLISISKVFQDDDPDRLANFKIYVDVYELKKDKCDLSSVEQICRYLNGVSDLMSSHTNEMFPFIGDGDIDVVLNGYLIGNAYSTEVIEVVRQLYDVHIYTYGFDMKNGMKFKRVNLWDGKRDCNFYRTSLTQVDQSDLIEIYEDNSIMPNQKQFHEQ